MKARIKFSKTGNMKFISHLDMIRYFQKAFRRAHIDIAYSKGFSPHQIASFSAPLSIGMTSESEYMDVELNSATTSQDMLDKLNSTMADGFRLKNIIQLEDETKKGNCMAIVSASDYEVTFREGFQITENQLQQFHKFIEQENILIVRKTKKKEAEVNIKPMIYQYRISYHQEIAAIFLQLATGSANNLKPELVIEAFYQYMELPFDEYSLLLHRKELYGVHGDTGELVPLYKMGKEFE